MQNVVIISPYFPPSTLAGVHRARHLAKHLPAVGWWPIVLCVDESHHEERLDPALAKLVPATVEIIKVPALSYKLTRPFGLGEISLRAFFQLRLSLFHLLATRSVDVVLITGSPFYPMLLAAEVKRRFGIPVVLDFQDPWASVWGETQPKFTKAGLSHWLAMVLEPRALQGASYVTSVSETQNAQLAVRYPWLDRAQMSAIPIGSDPEDFDALRNMSLSHNSVTSEDSHTTLSCVGALVPKATPVLEVFVRAVKRLRMDFPELVNRLQINFIGTSNQTNNHHSFRVRQLAEDAGVSDVIKEMPARIPYLDALNVLARSDGLLMIGSDEPHYTASKIYPNLMAARPFLSIYHRQSSAHTILTAAGGGVALAFSTNEELNALEAVISNGLYRLIAEPTTLGQPDPSAYAPYESRSIAQKYADVFNVLHNEKKES